MNIIPLETFKFGDKHGYTIDLKQNNMSGLRKDFKQLLGQTINIYEEEHKVIGIEAFATGEDYIHTYIGLLIA